MQLHAISVSQRRPADDFDLAGVFDFPHPPQLFAQNLRFARELELIRRVLVMAAPAAAENRAGRSDPLRRRLQNPGQFCVDPRADARPHSLARQNKRHENDLAPDPREPLASVHPFLDGGVRLRGHRYFVYDGISPIMKRVLSGIQPTGSPHIGNYLGALKNWAKIQYDYDSIYCIVDLHAITIYQDPKELRAKIRELAGMLLAIGIDPAHSALMVQSSVPQHAELAWMLTCVTPVGWLERMTQYKAKAQAQETVGDGILQYPVLMAADILLYDAKVVPVGDDQRQHLELAR